MTEPTDVLPAGPTAPAGAPQVASGPASRAEPSVPGEPVEPRAGSSEEDAGSTPVVGARTVEIAVSIGLLAFAGLMAFDNWRTGMGWAPDGPRAGYFPFYLSLILGGASLVGLLSALRRSSAVKGFVGRDQLRRVLQVFVPTAAFCLLTQVLGLYVASFLLIAGFMRFIGRIAWWKSIVTGAAFAVVCFAVFNLAFDVIMPKGPIEALLGR